MLLWIIKFSHFFLVFHGFIWQCCQTSISLCLKTSISCLFIFYLFPIYLQSDAKVLFIITAAVTTLASLVAHLKQGQELVTIILKLL